jgi:exopolysaccharide production protein ExoZ
VIAVGWSLEYEMYFYLAVALLIALTRQVWRNIVVIFSALAIAGRLPGVGTALGNYTFFTDPMILEFVLGVLAGHLFVHRRIGWPMLLTTACAFAALLIGDLFNRAIVAGIPACALVAAAAFISRGRNTPSWPERALARLGDASYSIYLAQVETVALAGVAIAKFFPAIPPLLLLAVTSCTVVALGLLLNIMVERPLLELCRGLRSSKPKRRLGLSRTTATR